MIKESSFSILRRERLMNVLAVLVTVMGVLAFFLVDNKFFSEVFPYKSAVLFPAGLTLLGVFIFLMNYLRSGNLLGTSNQDTLLRKELAMLRMEVDKGTKKNYASEKLQEEIKYLKHKIESVNFDRALVDDSEKEEMIKRIEGSVKKDVGRSLLKDIEERFSKDFKKERYLSELRNQCDITRSRLKEEIASLGWRGNVNLGIGVITTIAAVTILASTVISGDVNLKGEALLSYYFPRFTLSVFIEIFSFFFLRLYKAGLSEIKYFQNEMTNAELKFIAAEKAILLGNEGSIKSVIEELASTERNFKLNKGESTVELEKDRNERDSLNTILDSITKIVSSKK